MCVLAKDGSVATGLRNRVDRFVPNTIHYQRFCAYYCNAIIALNCHCTLAFRRSPAGRPSIDIVHTAITRALVTVLLDKTE